MRPCSLAIHLEFPELLPINKQTWINRLSVSDANFPKIFGNPKIWKFGRKFPKIWGIENMKILPKIGKNTLDLDRHWLNSQIGQLFQLEILCVSCERSWVKIWIVHFFRKFGQTPLASLPVSMSRIGNFLLSGSFHEAFLCPGKCENVSWNVLEFCHGESVGTLE